jgi:cupin 2 domain-containing protein
MVPLGDLNMFHLENIFTDLPAGLPDELVQVLLSGPGLSIERIVSLGHASPEGFWYDQEDGEWVLLLKGAARLRFEGEEPIELQPGSFVNIPAHRRHRVEWTDPGEPTVWLAVHYGDHT